MSDARAAARWAVAYRVAYWITPPLLCLAVHWLAFTAWFRADDFAWLGNAGRVHSLHDLLIALFQPRAQGTIRFLSERGFFLAGYELFGLNVWPFRIVIFATQFANLALVASIGTRLTGRPAAGFWAAILWTINSTSIQPLGWASAYNEVLCAFFLLLAFHFLLRFIETGERRYNAYQWIAFLAGFGALELNVVYPVLAAGYAWLCARKYFRATLPLFGASIGYTAVHLLAAPLPKTGVYAMHWSGTMLRTLATFWTWSVGPTYMITALHIRRWILPVGVALLTLTLLVFLVRSLRAGHNAALFCVLWYLTAIAPMLPLRDHRTEYYPFIPVIGICWLAGWALAAAWPQGTPLRVMAAALVALYAFLMLPRLWTGEVWNYDLTMRSRDLIAGVARAHELHPKASILLYGADTDQFWNVVDGRAFQLVGVNSVYLAPGTSKRIAMTQPDASVADFELPAALVSNALDRGELEVYDVTGPLLRNITSTYATMPRDRTPPKRIDAADGLTNYLMGPEWYPAEGDHRWMPKRATLRIGGPETAGQKLRLQGFCPAQLLRAGPLGLTVSVNGLALPAAEISEPSFDLSFPLPDAVTGKPEILVMIEVNRTIRTEADSRDLGVAFGVFGVER